MDGPGLDCPVALGKSGVIDAADKREGDRKTPAGRYGFRQIFWRPDRMQTPITRLPGCALQPDFGWCDDPGDPAYNRWVRLPFGRSHERLWREDGLYDLILVIGHNDDPVVPGLGSAVFVHCARGDLGPTQGCVALKKRDLVRLVRAATTQDWIDIRPR